MVALDRVDAAGFRRGLSVPTYAPGGLLGGIAGLGLILDFEIAVLTSLVTLAYIAKRDGVLNIAAWGGIYVLVTGLWLLPAAHSWLELSIILIGLPLAGAAFYGWAPALIHHGLRMPMPVALGAGFAIAEMSAAALDFSLAPIGLAAIGSGGEWIIAYAGVYAATALIALGCGGLALLGTKALAIAAAVGCVATFIPKPAPPIYEGPQMLGVAHNPDPIGKWTPVLAAESFEELINKSKNAKTDLSIWPENAVTHTMRIEHAVEQIPDEALPLLFGMSFLNDDGQLQNGAIYVDTDRRIQTSSKERLVPVIENGLWPTSRLQMQPGHKEPITLADGAKIMPLICYDAAFPIHGFSEMSLSAIVVLAAETGFWQPVGQTIMTRHIRARELETGLPFIHVSDATAIHD